MPSGGHHCANGIRTWLCIVNLTSIDVILKINDTFQIDNPHFVNYAVLPFILAVFQTLALLPSKFAVPCSGIDPNLE
jgi:hypothetical protein